MKYIYYIGLCFFVLFASACAEEEKLTPSGYEKNWMVIENTNPDDPVDNLRFQIYDTYGISTYYNDTIGQEERVNMVGENVMFYETLKVYYLPGSSKPGGIYYLLEDHSNLEPLLAYTKDHFFNKLPTTGKQPAFLFVREIRNSTYSTYKLLDTYMGFNTMVIRAEKDFASFDEEQREDYTITLLKGYFSGILSSKDQATWKTSFLKISRDLNPNYRYMYNSESFLETTVEKACSQTNLDRTLAALGFLVPYAPADVPEAKLGTPSEMQDIESYVNALFRYTPAEFKTMHEKHKVVMSKYNMIKEKVAALGYTID